MTEADSKHVFISYVRDDADQVDALCAVLEAAQIPYWRDRSALGPGDAWKAKIRAAIRTGSVVFLACFSDNSRARDRSYMNEELTLAVEEYRKMPPGRTWMIPLRFDAGDVPEWDLGAGRLLSDLNYLDLFGAQYAANAARLVTTILRLTGDGRPDAPSALAAVQQVTDEGRTDLLKRLTKDMLLDPARRIELDDLVAQEVRRVMDALTDAERFSAAPSRPGDEVVAGLVQQAQDLWSLVKPFCASLQVAARWGSAESLTPWTNGLRAFVGAANRPQGGDSAVVELRHLPGLIGIITATLAATSSDRWDNARVLVVEPTVRDRYEQKALPVLEATGPYRPFPTIDLLADALARSTITGSTPQDVVRALNEGSVGKYHTPVAEWLHHILRPMFIDQWPDGDAYDAEFDRMEVILGVLTQDIVNQRRAAMPDGRYWGRSHWFGRSTWRYRHVQANPADEMAQQLASSGAQWAPLRAGLFGGDAARAQAAVQEYTKQFKEIASQRAW